MLADTAGCEEVLAAFGDKLYRFLPPIGLRYWRFGGFEGTNAVIEWIGDDGLILEVQIVEPVRL